MTVQVHANWFKMKVRTERFLMWLYRDPHGQGISERLAVEKFGAAAVEEAIEKEWVDGDPLRFTSLGFRALAAKRGAKRRARSK